MGASDVAGEIELDWLGVPMYFSHADLATNVGWVEAAGLRLLRVEASKLDEHGAATPFPGFLPSGDGRELGGRSA